MELGTEIHILLMVSSLIHLYLLLNVFRYIIKSGVTFGHSKCYQIVCAWQFLFLLHFKIYFIKHFVRFWMLRNESTTKVVHGIVVFQLELVFVQVFGSVDAVSKEVDLTLIRSLRVKVLFNNVITRNSKFIIICNLLNK